MHGLMQGKEGKDINFPSDLLYAVSATVISQLLEYSVCMRIKCIRKGSADLMDTSVIILLAILVAAVLGHADSVAIATCALLIIKLLHVDKYIYPAIEKNGVSWGIALLTAAILIPIARGDVKTADIKNIFTAWIGIAALILSFLTTYLSGLGLQYLTVQHHSDVMPALILGSIAAAAFLGGVPVGPLITSGMLAAIAKLIANVTSQK